MTNTLFYTFSTIAQTLAGAFALLGAFVLYRLQSLRSDIERDSSEIANIYITHLHTTGSIITGDPHDWHREGEYRRVAGLPEGLDMPNFGLADPARARTMQIRLSRNLDQRDFLLKHFKASLWYTVINISSSVAFLVATEPIARLNIFCLIVLLGGFLGFGLCLYSYKQLIQKAIE
jgi:hypothetical protein